MTIIAAPEVLPKKDVEQALPEQALESKSAWSNRKVIILLGASATVAGATALAVTVAISSVLWPVAAAVLALGLAALGYVAFCHWQASSNPGQIDNDVQPLIEMPPVEQQIDSPLPPAHHVEGVYRNHFSHEPFDPKTTPEMEKAVHTILEDASALNERALKRHLREFSRKYHQNTPAVAEGALEVLKAIPEDKDNRYLLKKLKHHVERYIPNEDTHGFTPSPRLIPKSVLDQNLTAAPTLEPKSLELSTSDKVLAVSNAVQWGIIGATLFFGSSPITASIATAASICSGIANYCMLPKDASIVRKAMALPVIGQKLTQQILELHPVLKGISYLSQAHSLYTLTTHAAEKLSEAYEEFGNNPSDATKVGAVQLFNLASGYAFAAESAGLVKLKKDGPQAEPAQEQTTPEQTSEQPKPETQPTPPQPGPQTTPVPSTQPTPPQPGPQTTPAPTAQPTPPQPGPQTTPPPTAQPTPPQPGPQTTPAPTAQPTPPQPGPQTTPAPTAQPTPPQPGPQTTPAPTAQPTPPQPGPQTTPAPTAQPTPPQPGPQTTPAPTTQPALQPVPRLPINRRPRGLNPFISMEQCFVAPKSATSKLTQMRMDNGVLEVCPADPTKSFILRPFSQHNPSTQTAPRQTQTSLPLPELPTFLPPVHRNITETPTLDGFCPTPQKPLNGTYTPIPPQPKLQQPLPDGSCVADRTNSTYTPQYLLRPPEELLPPVHRNITETPSLDGYCPAPQKPLNGTYTPIPPRPKLQQPLPDGSCAADRTNTTYTPKYLLRPPEELPTFLPQVHRNVTETPTLDGFCPTPQKPLNGTYTPIPPQPKLQQPLPDGSCAADRTNTTYTPKYLLRPPEELPTFLPPVHRNVTETPTLDGFCPTPQKPLNGTYTPIPPQPKLQQPLPDGSCAADRTNTTYTPKYLLRPPEELPTFLPPVHRNVTETPTLDGFCPTPQKPLNGTYTPIALQPKLQQPLPDGSCAADRTNTTYTPKYLLRPPEELPTFLPPVHRNVTETPTLDGYCPAPQKPLNGTYTPIVPRPKIQQPLPDGSCAADRTNTTYTPQYLLRPPEELPTFLPPVHRNVTETPTLDGYCPAPQKPLNGTYTPIAPQPKLQQPLPDGSCAADRTNTTYTPKYLLRPPEELPTFLPPVHRNVTETPTLDGFCPTPQKPLNGTYTPIPPRPKLQQPLPDGSCAADRTNSTYTPKYLLRPPEELPTFLPPVHRNITETPTLDGYCPAPQKPLNGTYTPIPPRPKLQQPLPDGSCAADRTNSTYTPKYLLRPPEELPTFLPPVHRNVTETPTLDGYCPAPQKPLNGTYTPIAPQPKLQQPLPDGSCAADRTNTTYTPKYLLRPPEELPTFLPPVHRNVTETPTLDGFCPAPQKPLNGTYTPIPPQPKLQQPLPDGSCAADRTNSTYTPQYLLRPPEELPTFLPPVHRNITETPTLDGFCPTPQKPLNGTYTPIVPRPKIQQPLPDGSCVADRTNSTYTPQYLLRPPEELPTFLPQVHRNVTETPTLDGFCPTPQKPLNGTYTPIVPRPKIQQPLPDGSCVADRTNSTYTPQYLLRPPEELPTFLPPVHRNVTETPTLDGYCPAPQKPLNGTYTPIAPQPKLQQPLPDGSCAADRTNSTYTPQYLLRPPEELPTFLPPVHRNVTETPTLDGFCPTPQKPLNGTYTPIVPRPKIQQRLPDGSCAADRTNTTYTPKYLLRPPEELPTFLPPVHRNVTETPTLDGFCPAPQKPLNGTYTPIPPQPKLQQPLPDGSCAADRTNSTYTPQYLLRPPEELLPPAHRNITETPTLDGYCPAPQKPLNGTYTPIPPRPKIQQPLPDGSCVADRTNSTYTPQYLLRPPEELLPPVHRNVTETPTLDGFCPAPQKPLNGTYTPIPPQPKLQQPLPDGSCAADRTNTTYTPKYLLRPPEELPTLLPPVHRNVTETPTLDGYCPAPQKPLNGTYTPIAPRPKLQQRLPDGSCVADRTNSTYTPQYLLRPPEELLPPVHRNITETPTLDGYCPAPQKPLNGTYTPIPSRPKIQQRLPDGSCVADRTNSTHTPQYLLRPPEELLPPVHRNITETPTLDGYCPAPQKPLNGTYTPIAPQPKIQQRLPDGSCVADRTNSTYTPQYLLRPPEELLPPVHRNITETPTLDGYCPAPQKPLNGTYTPIASRPKIQQPLPDGSCVADRTNSTHTPQYLLRPPEELPTFLPPVHRNVTETPSLDGYCPAPQKPLNGTYTPIVPRPKIQQRLPDGSCVADRTNSTYTPQYLLRPPEELLPPVHRNITETPTLDGYCPAPQKPLNGTYTPIAPRPKLQQRLPDGSCVADRTNSTHTPQYLLRPPEELPTFLPPVHRNVTETPTLDGYCPAPQKPLNGTYTPIVPRPKIQQPLPDGSCVADRTNSTHTPQYLLRPPEELLPPVHRNITETPTLDGYCPAPQKPLNGTYTPIAPRPKLQQRLPDRSCVADRTNSTYTPQYLLRPPEELRDPFDYCEPCESFSQPKDNGTCALTDPNGNVWQSSRIGASPFAIAMPKKGPVFQNASHPVEDTCELRTHSTPEPQCYNPKALTGGQISGKSVDQDEPYIPYETMPKAPPQPAPAIVQTPPANPDIEPQFQKGIDDTSEAQKQKCIQENPVPEYSYWSGEPSALQKQEARRAQCFCLKNAWGSRHKDDERYVKIRQKDPAKAASMLREENPIDCSPAKFFGPQVK
ncbi:MAG: hypothetical protein K1X28_05670 [Parachlamydiales bacterium]|nr:hypothetical protein [Parachlamydiales bacterium]